MCIRDSNIPEEDRNPVYRDVVTGYPYSFDNAIAGNSGTTQNQCDGWFMGMVPNLVTGVWSGCEDRSAHFRTIQYGQGANMALPVYAEYLQRVYADTALTAIYPIDFDIPKSIDNELDCGEAIQAKNKEKLEEVKKEFSLDVDIFIAESNDEKALDNITQNTKVVLSTAGPFHRYGSKLVASCVKNSAHYVDITGENFWVKGLIDKHHDEASRKGIRIIPSCGYDSVPSDLGSFYCARSMNKPLKRIEAFHSFKGDASGGTLETMFSMADLNLGKKLFDPFLLNPEGTVTDEQKVLSRDKASVTSQDKINGWSGPFIMAAANTRVVRRSASLIDLSGQSYGSIFTYQEFSFNKKIQRFLMKKNSFITSELVLPRPQIMRK